MSASPGPWTIKDKDGDIDIYNVNDDMIASVYVTDLEEEGPTAFLIAAAPDLLAALKAYEAARIAKTSWPDVDIKVRAAISKAEGRS